MIRTLSIRLLDDTREVPKLVALGVSESAAGSLLWFFNVHNVMLQPMFAINIISKWNILFPWWLLQFDSSCLVPHDYHWRLLYFRCMRWSPARMALVHQRFYGHLGSGRDEILPICNRRHFQWLPKRDLWLLGPKLIDYESSILL